jgi:hypothetical protein
MAAQQLQRLRAGVYWHGDRLLSSRLAWQSIRVKWNNFNVYLCPPQIKAEAIAATVKHSTASSACRYPLDSPAGIVFVRTFNKERQRKEDAIKADQNPRPSGRGAIKEPIQINMQILSIAKIETEAVEASKTHSNVNDCCPYPFYTPAGRIYRLAFEAAIKHAEDPINVDAAIEIKHSLGQFEAVEGTTK